MAYLSPFIVRQCCSCRSLCGDCTENTLKKNTAQCCELFRLAQHCKVECRFLKWASGQPCKKKGNYLPSDMLMTHLLHLPTDHRDESELARPIVTCSFLHLYEAQPWLIHLTSASRRRFWLCLQLCQKTLMEYLTVPRCLPVHWTQLGNTVFFCYSALNSSELVVSAKDLQVDVLTAISGTPSTLLSVLCLCTWWSWVIVYFLSM